MAYGGSVIYVYAKFKRVSHHLEVPRNPGNEIVYVGDHGGCAEAATVQKLIHHELVRVNGVEVHGAYAAVLLYPE